MAYEVTKRVGERAYRYRVESVRDPHSGKRRSRWTYLGRAESGAVARTGPRRRTDARERLLDALESLIADRDFSTLTADTIAAEAGLAHGTFYRHFRDKRDALRAAFERTRERGPAIGSLRDDVASVDEARAGIRTLIEGVLRKPAEHPALLRAFFTLANSDPELARERRERKERGIVRIAEHLTGLRSRGLATVSDPTATATALFAMLDGFFREAVIDGSILDDAKIAGAAEVMDRAVFSDLGRMDGP